MQIPYALTMCHEGFKETGHEDVVAVEVEYHRDYALETHELTQEDHEAEVSDLKQPSQAARGWHHAVRWPHSTLAVLDGRIAFACEPTP